MGGGGAREMPQHFRALTALAEIQAQVPTPKLCLATICNSHLQVIHCSLLASVGTTYMWCAHIHTYIYAYIRAFFWAKHPYTYNKNK